MITMYQGGLGSGKTYDAVRKIISNLQNGRRILTNIDGFNNPINNEVIKHHFNLDDHKFKQQIIFLTSDDVKHFWDLLIPNDLIVIDESQNFFGSRNWSSKANTNFLAWATEHRHSGQDLLLISPKINMVDKQVRSMAEWIYSYKKVNMFGDLIQKKYIRFAYYEGDDTPISKKILTYDQLIFKCYSSYFSGEAKEINIEKGANILFHPLFLAMPIIIGLLIYFLTNSSLMGGGVTENLLDKKSNPILAESQEFHKPTPPTGEGRKVVLVSETPVIDQNIIGYLNGKPMYKTETGVKIEKN